MEESCKSLFVPWVVLEPSKKMCLFWSLHGWRADHCKPWSNFASGCNAWMSRQKRSIVYLSNIPFHLWQWLPPHRWSIDHRVNFLLTLPISPKDKCVSSLWGFITTSIMLLIIAVLIMLLQNATNVAKTALTENDKLRMEIKSCSTQSLGLEYHFWVTWIRQLVTRTWTWNSPLRDWTTSGVPQSCRTWTWTLVRLESCFWWLRLEIASLVTRTLTHHFWTRLQLWKSLN